ncbi:RraA family protein [Ktedonosporobacter rubrisoli]|uniref:Putative 4-hydroxy-4-methyl-2-oxoglutarate aldolase n=1 Tax=Ktedonosporobacter rubrisoli TaxID=2509675 RepID=A0A4P6JK44_KTERU|nr:RraA family protein [Ktedonosporobacter rubrisoli]QBD75509.1 RraA family protein [Ktedonosporobacter rubrisoli]
MEKFPEWLNATLASDASSGEGVLPNNILPLQPNSLVVGPAYVALMSQNDNLSVRKVLENLPEPGTVLVIAGGSTSHMATLGGLMALQMQNGGIAGLVTDGLVRDSREIREMNFPVWCRGVTPTAPKKNGPAIVGGTVSIGGKVIRDGDLVIADDDGVVIWPQERIAELLARAEARLKQDNERLARLQKQKR